MDTFHKILIKVFEATGGKETVDVDLNDIIKREGYLPSADQISSHLKSESWVTDSRDKLVRLTHWGIAEAKKVGSAKPDAARIVERESNRLLAEARSFGVVIEEFIADPTPAKLKSVDAKYGEMGEIVKKVREAM